MHETFEDAGMTTIIISFIAGALYFAGALMIARQLLRGASKGSPSKRTSLLLVSVAALLHAVVLSQTVLTDAGLHLGFYRVASLVGWAIAVMLLLVSARRPVENLGIFFFPLAALLVVAASFMSAEGGTVISASRGIDAHILTSLVAYSLFSLAAIQSLLLWLQNRQLRNRRPGGIIRALPPLQTMEALMFEMIVAGFVLLSLSLLTGLLYIDDIFAQHLLHKSVLSILAWGVFAILIWGRWSRGWRGRLAIRWTLVGFVTLMLAYFGSKFVLELLLERV